MHQVVAIPLCVLAFSFFAGSLPSQTTVGKASDVFANWTEGVPPAAPLQDKWLTLFDWAAYFLGPAGLPHAFAANHRDPFVTRGGDSPAFTVGLTLFVEALFLQSVCPDPAPGLGGGGGGGGGGGPQLDGLDDPEDLRGVFVVLHESLHAGYGGEKPDPRVPPAGPVAPGASDADKMRRILWLLNCAKFELDELSANAGTMEALADAASNSNPGNFDCGQAASEMNANGNRAVEAVGRAQDYLDEAATLNDSLPAGGSTDLGGGQLFPGKEDAKSKMDKLAARRNTDAARVGLANINFANFVMQFASC